MIYPRKWWHVKEEMAVWDHKAEESKAVDRHCCGVREGLVKPPKYKYDPGDKVFHYFGDCQAQAADPSALPGLSTASNVKVSWGQKLKEEMSGQHN